MSINYNHVILKIIYNGKSYNILESTLNEIDNLTGLSISKYDLLCNLIKSNKIKDKNIITFLKDIKESNNIGFPTDEECNFCFAIVIKGKTNEALPVIYNQSSFSHNDIYNQLKLDKNIYKTSDLYLKNIETDQKNINILYDILDSKKILNFTSLREDLQFYQSLKDTDENLLSSDEFKFLKDMKAVSIQYDKRKKNISKLISNIDKSLYKKHMLLSISKLLNNSQPKENEIIIYNLKKSFYDLEDKIIELTLENKRKKYE